jgi:hypothetical protein
MFSPAVPPASSGLPPAPAADPGGFDDPWILEQYDQVVADILLTCADRNLPVPVPVPAWCVPAGKSVSFRPGGEPSLPAANRVIWSDIPHNLAFGLRVAWFALLAGGYPLAEYPGPIYPASDLAVVGEMVALVLASRAAWDSLVIWLTRLSERCLGLVVDGVLVDDVVLELMTVPARHLLPYPPMTSARREVAR